MRFVSKETIQLLLYSFRHCQPLQDIHSSFYDEFYLFANTISLVITLVGFCGVLGLKKWLIAIHGLLTSGILGIFFLFSLIEVLFISDVTRANDSNHFSEFGTVFLLSLPYLVDFIAGMMTLYLAYLLFELEERLKPREQAEVNEDDEYEFPEDYDIYGDKCAICFERQKNSVIYRCGHKALCQQCAQQVRNSAHPRCPLCRANIEDIIPIYQ
eukprot:TRINITY_DN1433_c0_g1_i8.p1 TRINITY_DN1433_c0_g1~~TRINITY_DN1433_c0_g1_i8.p1  ORF type:complete len:213 (-),score=21.61 TRINITY_DN1433_c0_g1_i8:154-792(-)